MEYEQVASEGLILSSRVRTVLPDSRALRRDVDSGAVIRLRRGAYVARSAWEGLSARERHILRIRAVVEMAQRPAVVAGPSAAALWGMPISGDWPEDVTLLDEWLGGGRSEPGVRRTAAGQRTARTVEIRGIRVTTLARTDIDVARRLQLPDAIGSVDWARWRHNPLRTTPEELRDEVELVGVHSGKRNLERVVGFSTDLSDSFGESECRAVIDLLGFERPVLQKRFVDREGEMFPDFYWGSVGVAAEFDGKTKYAREEFTRGDPAEVVWREKKRQDRLLRQVNRMTRILTHHVKRPRELEMLLLEAGVPRVRGGR